MAWIPGSWGSKNKLCKNGPLCYCDYSGEKKEEMWMEEETFGFISQVDRVLLHIITRRRVSDEGVTL